MQSNASPSQAADLELGLNDLGPLAWVIDELRKSLEGAVKAMKRFVRDAEVARGSDLAAIDSSQLRIARQQLHQSVGALEMVGLPAPAMLLKGMEAAVQRFVQQPENCTADASTKLERASFALTEYLQGVLSNRPVSSISLFPQYREIQEIVRAERIHPADLWSHEWRWLDPKYPEDRPALFYGPDSRALLDRAILPLMKGRSPDSAQTLRDLCLGFSAGQTRSQPKIFWKLAAAFFEALAQDVLKPDVYVKRASSRILLQYASLAKGVEEVSDRLAQDLIFFCAQAGASGADGIPLLAVVRELYGLDAHRFVDYELVQFGRFDPATLSQARKRIAAAKDTWSAVSAGDVNKFKSVSDQFGLVADSLIRLHPASGPLAQALTQAIHSTVQLAQPPRIELAMEVATSVMYLEAVFEDLDPNDPLLEVRTRNLAERLEGVRAGGEPQPLESWMEELYGRISDKQTMGSVVGELRVSLGELEKGLDAFFRNPKDKSSLQAVPGQLSQMRGVLSVLGLDQAAHTVLRMRESVEQMLDTDVNAEQASAAGTFDQLGNNVGSLSFLIDMLNYQPALTKKLFVFDEQVGELKPIMGRRAKRSLSGFSEALGGSLSVDGSDSVAPNPMSDSGAEPSSAKIVDSGAAAPSLDAQQYIEVLATKNLALGAEGSDFSWQGAASLTVEPTALQVDGSHESEPSTFTEDDLQEIFLEEAREVVAAASEALSKLADNPGDVLELTVLRRAFHTLKGSSRMVGLKQFGDAAWSFEQLNNSWLADQKPASADFRTLMLQALGEFESWISAIASRDEAGWSSLPFSTSADAMRASETYVALAPKSLAQPHSNAGLSGGLAVSEQGRPSPALEPGSQQSSKFDQLDEATDLGEFLSGELSPEIEGSGELTAPIFSGGADFGFLGHDGRPKATLDALTFPASPTMPVAGDEVQSIEDVDFDALFGLPEDGEREALAADRFFADAIAQTENLPTNLTPLLSGSRSFSLDEPVREVSLDPALTSAAELDDLSAWPISIYREPADHALDTDAGTETEDEEQVRVIGALRIGIPLYNVYLNEADEWSRRLVTEIGEWALEVDRPVSDTTVALAHSLAGSSATVGFQALSSIARMFERALQKSQSHYSAPHHAYSALFSNTSEEIRRLLHQFAAGFLKEADPEMLEQLKNLDFPDSISNSSNESSDFDTPPVDKAPQFLMTASKELLSSSLMPSAVLNTLACATTPEVVVVEPIGTVQTVLKVSAVPSSPEVLDRDVSVLLPLVGELKDLSDQVGIEAIDAIDAIDPDLFPIFEEEAKELMPQLGGALRQWAGRPNNQRARLEVLRVLHTLKGSSRLAGAMRLGELTHRIESQIESLGTEPPPADEFDELLVRFDAMQNVFDSLCDTGVCQSDIGMGDDVSRGTNGAEVEAQAWMTSVDLSGSSAVDQLSVRDQIDFSHENPAVALRSSSLLEGSASIIKSLEIEQGETLRVAAALADTPTKTLIPPPQAMVMASVRQAAGASVRVRSQLLDRMVNQAGEVMITRSRLEAELMQLRSSLGDMNSNLNRLRQHLRDIELQAETQMQSRLAQAKEAQAGFDPLEIDRFTRVQELTRMMAESVNDVATVQRTLQRTVEATEDDLIAQARQTRELQRDLLRTRMVEFESIADRLYRVVRQASKDTGKQVKLDLLGGTIEMDRGMLDRMTPAFEHLLRNCVAHGIEDRESREASGKDPVGLIAVHLRHEGNDVSVDFSDDGSGLNIRQIQEKAVTQGLIEADAVLTEQQAADLIFLPGFTTAAQITELAGRGIGMDVVRSEVQALGGRIETNTVVGKGTHFKLVLPLTTAVTQVVMIRSGALSIGVPAHLIETVRRVSANDLQAAYASGTFELAGSALPFFWSGLLLQASFQSAEPATKTLPVVVFRSADQRLALHVDEVIGNQEVVVKNLGPQLSRLPGLSGMSVLASGDVVLIYNPVALASIYGVRARAWATANQRMVLTEDSVGGGVKMAASEPSKVPLVLVVDDSITVRRVTQRLLQREGFRVAMAADGLQALERLQDELPSVVLSDIEMPRMDGFDLARNIRADARLKSLPIIMITSRIAAKHREYAMELGVDNYLGKPYSEEELIRLVRQYCATEATCSA